MKTSTIVILGLGAAAVLFFVLRPSILAGPAKAGTAPAMKPGDTALNEGIKLGAQALSGLIAGWTSAEDAPISLEPSSGYEYIDAMN